MEAVRLRAGADALQAAVDLLDAQGAALLRQGYAARLWQVLRGLGAPALVRWQLRCANALGNPTALAEIQLLGVDSDSDPLSWARTLLAQGDIEAAVPYAEQILSDDADPERRGHAALILSACLIHQGRFKRAQDVLATSALKVDRKSTRLNSSHTDISRMPSSA